MWSKMIWPFLRRAEVQSLPVTGDLSVRGENSRVTTEVMTFLEGAPSLDDERPEEARRRKNLPTLVEVGVNTGASRVLYRGHNIDFHLLTKDFFISVINIDTWLLFSYVAIVYLVVFFFWSLFWWLIMHFAPGCLVGPSTRYVDALAFSTITQMTLGYGNTAPASCWVATWLVIIQMITAIILEAIVLGIIFAKISHPHQRSRSIFISDKAIISRRDGILKFMFRVADIRNAQVVEPKVKAYLYTWGDGRVTAEGERIPVRVEPLEVDYIDGMLLLPLIIEHTIDERSPLCGHTASSLASLNAEVVVTFEGTTEMGNPFMTRRSYIADEIFWGYQFINIVVRPTTGSNLFSVDLDQFNNIELQVEMPDLPPDQLSQLVVNRAKRTVPYPLLGENTLVLSDLLCVAPNEDGQLCLMARVGDTYPNQMLEITAKMYLYRWKDPVSIKKSTVNLTAPGTRGSDGFHSQPSISAGPSGVETEDAVEEYALDCGYKDGTDRLYLRLPTILAHVIDNESPLASWREPGGLEADFHSEVVVVINAYMNVNTHNILRQRTYSVGNHLRYGFKFSNIIRHPALSSDRKPRIRWHRFHDIVAVDGMGKFPAGPRSADGASAPNGDSRNFADAPEAHDNQRTIEEEAQARLANFLRNDFTVIPGVDLQRYAQAVGGDDSTIAGRISQQTRIPESVIRQMARFAQNTLEASDSLPHTGAMHPAIPGPDRFRQSDVVELNQRTDYTVLPMDLHRYSMAVAGPTDDSVPPPPKQQTFVPLPPDFKESAKAAAAEGETARSSLDLETVGAQRSSSEVAPVSGAPVPPSVDSGAGSGPAATGTGDVDAELEGPLAGVHMAPGAASSDADLEGGESAAGPIHFMSSKDRQGGKSYVDIHSLFAPEGEGDGGSKSEEGAQEGS